jgi:hypothetical protein
MVRTTGKSSKYRAEALLQTDDNLSAAAKNVSGEVYRKLTTIHNKDAIQSYGVKNPLIENLEPDLMRTVVAKVDTIIRNGIASANNNTTNRSSVDQQALTIFWKDAAKQTPEQLDATAKILVEKFGIILNPEELTLLADLKREYEAIK